MSSHAGVRVTGWAIGLLAAFILLLVGAEPASATWLTAVPVSTAALQGRTPEVGIDGAGDVTVAWAAGETNREILVSEHHAGGEWTAPVARIAASQDCFEPHLAVSSTGAAVIVADCKSGSTPMRAAYRDAAGSWSSSTEIPGSGTSQNPEVAIDGSGNAVVVWEASNTVQSSYKKAGQGWEASPLRVSPVGKVSDEPDVTVSPTGRAIAVWAEDRDSEPSDPVVQADSISRQGSAAWSGYQFLSGTATGSFPVIAWPQVVMTTGGRFATFSAQAASPNPLFLKKAWGNGSDFGGWDPSGNPNGGDGVHAVEAPKVGLDGSGRAVVVWRSFDGANFGVQASTTGFINDTLSSPVTLLASGGNGFFEPQVAVNLAGEALLTWRTSGVVTAVAHSPATGFGSPLQVNNSGHSGFEEPRVAVGANGDGVVVYSAEYGSALRIEAAVNDVTPPTVSASAPATATTGTAVAMTASASDTWSPVSLAWDFGDGATATGASVSHAYATAGAKTVTVTATDAAGNSATATASIQVSEPSGGGVGGGGNGGGGGGGGGGKSVALTVKLPRQAWKQIARAKAIKLKCKLEVAGICRVKATVAAGLAKGLGLAKAKARAPVKVGAGSAAVNASRFAVVKVKLTAKALARIGAATRKVPVKLAVTGSASGRQPATATKTLPIRRP